VTPRRFAMPTLRNKQAFKLLGESSSPACRRLLDGLWNNFAHDDPDTSTSNSLDAASRLIEISDVLGIHIQKRVELLDANQMRTGNAETWKAFPIAEMYKRGWFEDFSGTMNQARKAASELIPTFLSGTHSLYAPSAMHRKSVRANGAIHEASIAAWEVRVRRLADRNPPETQFVAGQIQEDGPSSIICRDSDSRWRR
jgi:HTH-type transcriptional regulator / antitoxin HigA